MSDLYLDEIEKIKYYKQKIVDRYLKQGLAVDKEKVQEFLDNVDTKIALFSQSYIQSGNDFNVDAFNQQKQDIYRDLVVLYKVIYKLVKERLTDTETRIHFLLNALEEETKEYKFLVDSQVVSIYGNTIFHQTSNFDQQYKNGQVIINLGEISVPSGSYLVGLLQCTEVDPSNVTFYFDDQYNIQAYNYSHRYLQVLGNYKLDTETHENTNSILGKELIHTESEISVKNQYNVFLNQNQVKIKDIDRGQVSYATKNKETYLKVLGRSEISFYVYGASYIKFDTIGNIEYTNFLDNKIDHPMQRQKIVIKAQSGFSFDIVTDGTIFAEKANTLIQDDGLKISQNYSDVTDYMIETISFGDDVIFDNVYIVIDNATNTLYDIDYIAIKQTQISELENNDNL